MFQSAGAHVGEHSTPGTSLKKLVNLEAAVAIFMAWYQFCRVHQTLRVTPAMEAGLTTRVWTMRDLLTWQGQAEQAA